VGSYEIFGDLPNGPVWVESVPGFNYVAERLQALNEKSPGQYFASDVPNSYVVAKLSCKSNSASIADEARAKSGSWIITFADRGCKDGRRV
jgi:hypothetical protein